jgi:hypothetical protein
VNDAVYLLPGAFALVASDASWWLVNEARLGGYPGARIMPVRYPDSDPPRGVTPLQSCEGESFAPFSAGQCSGFAAISYALHLGYKRVALVGFDMRTVDGKRHFFGDHPLPLRNTDPQQFTPYFERAAELLPDDVTITNCTPHSALRCFPFADLEDCL